MNLDKEASFPFVFGGGSAVMTCIVPSPLTNDHMHFVDGGSDGYALAAVQLKKAIVVASE